MALQEEYSDQRMFECSNKMQKYKCESCPNFQTDLLASLRRHIRDGHSDQNPEDIYKCLKCFFVTASKYLIVRHGFFNDCAARNEDENVSSINQSESEPTILFSKEPENAQRSFVSYRSKQKGYCRRHVRVSHKKPEWFKCGHCSSNFKTKSSLKRHVINRHLKEEAIHWYECEQCPSKFKVKYHLPRHIITHHTKPEDISWHKCPHCSFKSKLGINLKMHIRVNHLDPEDIRWIQCGQCPLKFKKKENLRQHIIHRHTQSEDVRWFLCAHCPSKFKTNAELRRHVISRHTQPEDIRWYDCPHCSFKSKLCSGLNRHVKLRHGKQEPDGKLRAQN